MSLGERGKTSRVTSNTGKKQPNERPQGLPPELQQDLPQNQTQGQPQKKPEGQPKTENQNRLLLVGPSVPVNFTLKRKQIVVGDTNKLT